MTDSESARIAHQADFLFLTPTRGYAFPDSVAGAQLIANILVALTVSKLGPDALDRIRRNELEIEETGEYVVERRTRKEAPPAKRRAARRRKAAQTQPRRAAGVIRLACAGVGFVTATAYLSIGWNRWSADDVCRVETA